MSSRHPEELEPLAKELGPRAHVGTPREAAAFGSVVLVSVPYGAMPQIGADFARRAGGQGHHRHEQPRRAARRRRRRSSGNEGCRRRDGRAAEEQPRRARVQLHSGGLARRAGESPAGADRDSDRRRRCGGDRGRGAARPRGGLRPGGSCRHVRRQSRAVRSRPAARARQSQRSRASRKGCGQPSARDGFRAKQSGSRPR